MLPAILEDEHVNCACPASGVYQETGGDNVSCKNNGSITWELMLK